MTARTKAASAPTLDEIRDRHEVAVAERDEAEIALADVRAQAEQEIAEAASQLGLGRTLAAGYDTVREAANARVTDAELTLERCDAALAAISELAAAEAEREAAERVAAARAKADKIQVDVNQLDRQLTDARTRLDAAEERVEEAEEAALNVRAEFNEDAAQQLRERRLADRKVIDWYAKALPMASQHLPPKRRALVEARRAELLLEAERAKETQRIQAEASMRAAGFTETGESVRALDAAIMRQG